MLLAMIADKAETAGGQVLAVAPRNTSLSCAVCGHLGRENRSARRCFGVAPVAGWPTPTSMPPTTAGPAGPAGLAGLAERASARADSN